MFGRLKSKKIGDWTFDTFEDLESFVNDPDIKLKFK